MKRLDLLRVEARQGRAGRGQSRRAALLARARLMPTRFQNRSGRYFYLTTKGSYVVLEYGRRVYGRKVRFMDGKRVTNASRIPARIRPKRV